LFLSLQQLKNFNEMKKIIFLFFACFILVQLANSQKCLPEGIWFQRQSQLDSFKINYPTCNHILGNVIISGIDIDDLSGLNNIETIDSVFVVDGNPLLQNLSGMEKLKSIGSDMDISNNSLLEDIKSLSSLTTIYGDVSIEFNPKLKSLEGLENLNSIGLDLDIVENNSLTSMKGLDSLSEIGSVFTIEANAKLMSLEGIKNLDYIQALIIVDNSQLTTCAVAPICDFLNGAFPQYQIHGNNIGCNGGAEIKAKCASSISDDTKNLENVIIYFDNGSKNLIINSYDKSFDRISVYNSFGQIIFNDFYSQNSRINLSEYQEGLYIVEISDGDKTAFRKFILH
jgi:hypothetical protein